MKTFLLILPAMVCLKQGIHTNAAAAQALPGQCRKCPGELNRTLVNALAKGEAVEIGGSHYIAVDPGELPTAFNPQYLTFKAACVQEETKRLMHRNRRTCTYRYTLLGVGPSYRFTLMAVEPVLTMDEILQNVGIEVGSSDSDDPQTRLRRMEQKYYKKHMALARDIFATYPFDKIDPPFDRNSLSAALRVLFIDLEEYGPIDLKALPPKLIGRIRGNYDVLQLWSAPRMVGKQMRDDPLKIMAYAVPAYDFLARHIPGLRAQAPEVVSPQTDQSLPVPLPGRDPASDGSANPADRKSP